VSTAGPGPPGIDEAATAGSWQPPARPSLAKHTALGVAVSAGTLVASLVTGIIAARVLGPSGRGVLAAVLVFPQTVGMAFTLGCAQSIAFHQAREPGLAARLLSTWGTTLAAAAVAAIAVGMVLVPVALGALSAHAQTLARIYLVTVVVVLLTELVYGVLLGDQDFGFLNLMRLMQPALVAVAFAALWLLDAFTVESALAVSALVPAAVLAMALRRVLRRHGVARPSRALRWRTLRYGLQIHGTVLTGMLTARLAMLVIPAVLGATLVGYYAIAFNLSQAVASLATTLPLFVLPVAARAGEKAPRIVLLSLYATLALGGAVSLLLIGFAEVAVPLVYGSEFESSVTPLRILLLGTTFFVGANILIVGMNALNRPFAGALAYAAGLSVTGLGLLLFVESGGIDAAAAVSSAAGLVVFGTTLAMYRRFTGLSWGQLLPSRSDLAEIAQRAVGLLHRR
jgi:O-antigen/teichoic acid export membrane protein